MVRSRSRPDVRDAALDRVLRFLQRTLVVTADEVRRIDDGMVVRTPSLPAVWNLNQLRIAGSIAFADALALADEHLRHVPYRHVVFEREETGRRLEPDFRAAGWRPSRELLMVLRGTRRREPGDAEVIEPGEGDTLALLRRWSAEDPRDISQDAIEQLAESSVREARGWGEQRFGVVGDGDRLAAITKLRADGATAQVEDVYTVPEARRRGFARALVIHAAARALADGNDLVFIVADDDDWPKHLYRRLGFEPLSRLRVFHLALRFGA